LGIAKILLLISMFKLKRVQIRSSTDILFFHEIHTPSNEYFEYFKNAYVKTKKWIESQHTLSENGLEYKSVTFWRDQDDFLEFANDEYILENSIILLREHNSKYSIDTIFDSEYIDV
jgi:hypothetical protein